MIVAVALAGIFLGVYERRERFRRISRAHSSPLEGLGISDLEVYLLLSASQSEPAEAQEERLRVARPLVQFLEYHRNLAKEYEFAANRPWLLIAPDPPAPPMPSKEYLRSIIDLYCRVASDPAPYSLK
jgi:hypothetical protein